MRRCATRTLLSCANGDSAAKRVSSLKEPGEELLTFLQFPKPVEGAAYHQRSGADQRRVPATHKDPSFTASEDAVLLLLFGLLRSGQIVLRRVDVWQDLAKLVIKSQAA